MDKEVLIKMSGVLSADSDAEVDILCAGEYYYRNGKHFVRYEEKVSKDSTNTDTQCLIKFDKNTVELSKKGVVSARLMYEPGKTHIINYTTEYGDFLIGIQTDALRLFESEHLISLEIDYVVEIEQSERNVFHVKLMVSDEPESVF